MFRKKLAESAAAAEASMDVGKYFIIRSKLNDLVLDMADGSTATNTAITTAQETGADSQLWYLDIINGTIRNKNTAYAMNMDCKSLLYLPLLSHNILPVLNEKIVIVDCIAP